MVVELADTDGLEGIVVFDPSTSLIGAKGYLADHDFKDGFGDPETQESFDRFLERETKDGSYAGKSLKWRGGGAAAVLTHKLIVSGDYGDSLEDIGPEEFKEIKDVVRINYFRKLAGK